MDGQNSYRAGPDDKGRFGHYGGRFVAETLMPLILDLEAAYKAAQSDPAFEAELVDLQTHYVGRPSPLYFAERLTEHYGGAKIYLKRDELNHTGSHKINNCLGIPFSCCLYITLSLSSVLFSVVQCFSL